jgi:hypothetical protein
MLRAPIAWAGTAGDFEIELGGGLGLRQHAIHHRGGGTEVIRGIRQPPQPLKAEWRHNILGLCQNLK